MSDVVYFVVVASVHSCVLLLSPGFSLQSAMEKCCSRDIALLMSHFLWKSLWIERFSSTFTSHLADVVLMEIGVLCPLQNGWQSVSGG